MASGKDVVDGPEFAIIDEPPLWKWLFSLAIFGVLLSTLYCFDLFGQSFYYLTLHQDLVETLDTPEDIPQLAQNERFKPLLHEREDVLKVMTGVQGYVAEREYTRAISWTKNQVLAKANLSKPLNDAVTALQNSSQQATEAAKAFIEAKQNLQGLRSQYAVLASSFARLLEFEDLAANWQLTAAAVAKDSNPEYEVNWYTEGAFAGLPKLEGVPDGLEKHRDVKEFLSSSNANSIARMLNWSKSPVRSEIQAIQAQAADLQGSLALAQTALERCEADNLQAAASIEEAYNQYKEVSTTTITTLAKPDFNERALQVYKLLYPQVKPYLPALPSPQLS